MRKVLIASTLLMAILLNSVGLGQEAEPSSRYEHLKAYESLIGEWRYEGPMLETAAEIEKGTPLLIDYSWQWTLDKNAIAVHWRGNVNNGEMIISGTRMVGWNSVKQHITAPGFTSYGHCSQAIVSISDDGKKFTLSGKNFKANGEEENTCVVFEVLDEDTFTWQAINRENNDLPPESPKFTFKRVKPTENPKLPAEFVKVCQYFMGEWATEGEIDGTTYKGTWTAKWSPDRECLISRWAANTPYGPASGTRIQGWDSVAKKMLVVDFGTDGSSSVERYVIVSDKVDEAEIEGVDREGNPRKATARTFRKEQDFFTWTVTEDGQSVEYKFRRVKE